MPIQLNAIYEKNLLHKEYISGNPISTRGGTLSPPSTARPPDFQTLRHACIWKACFFHELIQYALLDLLCEKMLDHKDYI